MNENTNNTPMEDKTFTQEDVNRIVSERLSKEKSKIDATLAEREQELAHKEFVLSAKEQLTQKGLPVGLLDALNTSTPEAFNSGLEIIEKTIREAQPRQNVPRYAEGTGSAPMLGDDGDSIRKAMGLNRKE